jgi:hypothetical protein
MERVFEALGFAALTRRYWSLNQAGQNKTIRTTGYLGAGRPAREPRSANIPCIPGAGPALSTH